MFTPPKLPSSTVLAALDWQDTPEFWTSLRSYTNEIDQSQRGTLIKIIRAYIHEVEFEQNATSVTDAEKRLGEIEAAAEAFWRVLDCPSESIGHEAVHFVEGLLNVYLEDRGSPDNPLRVSHLSHTMLTFVEVT